LEPKTPTRLWKPYAKAVWDRGMIFSPSLTLGKCIAFNPQMVEEVFDPDQQT
jgi:hypothetical protein